MANATTRNELRLELFVRRAKPTIRGFRAKCAACGKPLKIEEAVIHEWLITRAQLRDIEKMPLIAVPENSALVHFGCNPENGRGGRNFKKIALAMVEEVGLDAITAWLDLISLEMPFVAEQARRDLLWILEAK